MDHEISTKAAELGMDHAQQSEEQSQAVQSFGQSLQNCLDEDVVEQGKRVERYGKQAEQHARASYTYAETAKATKSTREYSKAVKEHTEEVRQFNKAVQAYGKVLGKDLAQQKQKLDRRSHPNQG